MSAARWQEGGSSGHRLATEKLVWASESKLTPSSRESGQGVREDRGHEELEERLLGGWNFCFASEREDLKGQEDKPRWWSETALAIRDQPLLTCSWTEISLPVAHSIWRLRVFMKQKDLHILIIRTLVRRLLNAFQSPLLGKATNCMLLVSVEGFLLKTPS